SSTNLGYLFLCYGNVAKSTQYLKAALRDSEELSFVRLGTLDNMAHVMLHLGNLGEAERYIRDCAATISAQKLPVRSWYDLGHDVTRCLHRERIDDWHGVVDIVDAADDETSRRQFRTVRTALLCAKARALANLGKHSKADAVLAMAVRTCPRGAIE